MTIPVSTVPAAIAALLAQITTQVSADALQITVCQGQWPMDYEPDIIQVATNVRRIIRPEAFLGSYQAGSLQEDYTISCIVSSWSGNPDPALTVNRAYVLAGYIETAVRTDPTLGTTVIEAHPAGSDGGNADWTESPVGRLCEITVDVFVTTIN